MTEHDTMQEVEWQNEDGANTVVNPASAVEQRYGLTEADPVGSEEYAEEAGMYVGKVIVDKGVAWATPVTRSNSGAPNPESSHPHGKRNPIPPRTNGQFFGP